MISIKLLMVMTLFLSSMLVFAQGNNAKTINVKIFGNCDICEGPIEKAGNVKNMVQVDWNKDTQMATVTFDSNETNQGEILKRIALAGYDSDQFLAPEEAYAKLPDCCKYIRSNKTEAIMSGPSMKMETSSEESHIKESHANHGSAMKMKANDKHPVKMESHADHGSQKKMENSILPTKNVETQKSSELQPVFDLYFEVKDALVQTNGKAASTGAKALVSAIEKVKMGDLESKVHDVWMIKMKSLKENSEKISQSSDPAVQRGYFAGLSGPMYDLIKVSNPKVAIYYQKCPMYNNGKGANWLSKDSEIKNPFYGSMMMTCGSTIEKITN
jgi:hypothetical protein